MSYVISVARKRLSSRCAGQSGRQEGQGGPSISNLGGPKARCLATGGRGKKEDKHLHGSTGHGGHDSFAATREGGNDKPDLQSAEWLPGVSAGRQQSRSPQAPTRLQARENGKTGQQLRSRAGDRFSPKAGIGSHSLTAPFIRTRDAVMERRGRRTG